VLLDKFLYYRPTYRLLAEWQSRGLDLALGTLTDGLQRHLPLFQPVYDEGLILLAFCWADVRRDSLGVARSWPEPEDWALGWVGRIGPLYQDNEARLEALGSNPEGFAAKDGQRRRHVEGRAEQAKRELADPKLHPVRQGVLTSWPEHGDGLTVFVEHPEVLLDNT
jgi:hypothetical protein